MAVLIVHGGAGAPPEAERPARQAAVERALETGWEAMGLGPLEAVQAAVRHLEDEPLLNAAVAWPPNLSPLPIAAASADTLRGDGRFGLDR
jgi:isoaspartyl peptidase/L-asparaginase-like protein (Ntn-hydrolase superfamily)